MASKISPEDIAKIAMKTTVPVVLKDFVIPWKSVGSSLQEFCEIFDKLEPLGVSFDRAPVKHGSCPQWEFYREKTPNMSLSHFMKFCSSQQMKDYWMSYSYKSLGDLPEEIGREIDFTPMGFPEIQSDITMWLGSQGAHTPCHKDSYGRNIVVQIFGRKRWILFSPEVDLKPTRCPYEESSIYSNLNFFSPEDWSDFKEVTQDAHIFTLEPGDVLIVPPKWWHYVENLEPALTLNAWIPLQEDRKAQIQECFTKVIIFQHLHSSSDFKEYLINPNEQETFEQDPHTFLRNHLKLLNYLEGAEPAGKPKSSLSDAEFRDLIEKNTTVSFVEKSSIQDFLTVLEKNAERFDPNRRFEESNEMIWMRKYIDSVCHPDVIEQISRKHKMLG
ncbi:HSPB1-associated protein 1 [Sergentomyia squamirostris]